MIYKTPNFVLKVQVCVGVAKWTEPAGATRLARHLGRAGLRFSAQ
jgi:hypothetical protein